MTFLISRSCLAKGVIIYDSDSPDRVVRFPHAAAPQAWLAAVDVEWGLISSAVTLRTRLVVILKNLDS